MATATDSTSIRNRLNDLRDRVMTMESHDCRQELADTILILMQLVGDFSIALREIAMAHYDQKSEVCETSRDFNLMAERHGVESI